MKGIIYIATNLFNGKSYVGQTRVTLEKRKSQHLRDAKSDDSNHFHIALAQYGLSGFDWSILDEFEGTKEEVIHALNVAEEYHILKRRTFLDEYGYNATKGGYSSDVFSEQVKRLSNKGGRVRILQYDLKGNYLREFPSMQSIADEFGCKSVGTVIFDKQWRGFQWRRRDGLEIPKKISPYIKPKRSSAVIVYTPDGKFYNEYESINKCTKDLGKQLSIKEFSESISRPSYLKDSMLVFRMRDREYPKTITIDYRYPKNKDFEKDTIKRLPVLQYTSDGYFVKEFPSTIDAHRETGVSEKSIREWCKKELPLAIRLKSTTSVWRYKTDDFEQIIPITGVERKKYLPKMEHRVIQCDKQGNAIRVWKNISQASLHTGDSVALIKKQCEGGVPKKEMSSIWRYYKDKPMAM